MLAFKAQVNVPGLGERTVQRDIAGSQFTTGSEVQVCQYTEAAGSLCLTFYPLRKTETGCCMCSVYV